MNQFNAKRISFGVKVSRWEVNKLGEFTPLLRLQLKGQTKQLSHDEETSSNKLVLHQIAIW